MRQRHRADQLENKNFENAADSAGRRKNTILARRPVENADIVVVRSPGAFYNVARF